MEILLLIAKCLFFLIPAYVANVLPIIAARFKILESLNLPIDGNLKFKGEPLLGTHKTVRGFVLGILGAIIIVFIQYLAHEFSFIHSISLVNYSEIDPLFLGFLIGFGTLFGDAVGSFIKRRIKIKSGDRWLVGDQIDMALGVLLFTMPIYQYDVWAALTIVLLTFFLHILGSRIGYFLRLRKEKW
jgi:CDP-2,3-bis-(O-geranylgeranyl)-sn-glycerol synthase